MEIKKTIYDFSELNHLPPDVKILLVNGQKLVGETKDMIKNQGRYFDMTSKIQLKNDCKEIEKYIKLIEKGKLNDKNKKDLELATIRLKTTLDGVVRFYTR